MSQLTPNQLVGTYICDEHKLDRYQSIVINIIFLLIIIITRQVYNN